MLTKHNKWCQLRMNGQHTSVKWKISKASQIILTFKKQELHIDHVRDAIIRFIFMRMVPLSFPFTDIALFQQELLSQKHLLAGKCTVAGSMTSEILKLHICNCRLIAEQRKFLHTFVQIQVYVISNFQFRSIQSIGTSRKTIFLRKKFSTENTIPIVFFSE